MTFEQLFNVLMTVLIKPCLMLAIYYFVVRSLTRSASARHFLLAFGLCSLLLIPLLSVLGPTIHWTINPQQFFPLESAFWQSSALTEDNVWIGFAVYVFVALWLVFYQFAGLAVLMVDTHHAQLWKNPSAVALVDEISEQLMLNRNVSVVLSNQIYSAQVWGIWHSTIMLPPSAASWSEQRLRFVLTHEMAHVARWDWPSTQVLKLICALFWFLPPVWWLTREARECAELASDDHIQRLEGLDLNSVGYAEHLFDLACCARNPHFDSAMQIQAGSPMFQRVNAVLDEHRERAGLDGNQKGWAMILAVAILIPLASVQASSIQYAEKAINEVKDTLMIVLDADSKEAQAEIPFVDLPVPDVNIEQLKQELLGQSMIQRPTFELEVIAPLSRSEDQSFTNDFDDVQLASVLEPEVYIRGYMPKRLVTPNYPRRALARGIEGEVKVQFDISEQGQVDNVRVVYAKPSRVFNRAVLKAVKQFQFRPQMISGQAVRVRGVSEVFSFKLEDPNAPLKEQGVKRRSISQPDVTELAQFGVQ